MATRIKIEGLKQLDKALGELPKSTAKAVLRKVLKEAGEPVAAAARGNAPRLTGNLYEHTDYGTKLTRRQASLHRRATKDDRDFAEGFVGTSDPAGMQDEFGNEHQAAQPWLRPAWDTQKNNALFIITHRLWVVIEEAAARLARRNGKGR
ncbi:HK97-gp10 family putative phage morphogenesis protein [Rhizobium leguminosarum]|uniref:HK97-gp10 family putative phage morphogenesis protein n=1 Tax=Rhizobium leguminosarum TaxID=384 RepID=UPI000487AB2F|nr:HK97-gp10 family putative phage morphogenesis protein [Rhizobium leguminosarum]